MKMLPILFILLSVYLNDVISQKAQSNDKIVEGIESVIAIVPYLMYLQIQNGSEFYSYGASIISPTKVLTTAQCLYGRDKVYGYAGSTDRGMDAQKLESINMTIHPKYNATSLDYNIGIVEFPEINIDNIYTSIIRITDTNTAPEAGTLLQISGWGLTKENGTESTNVNIDVVSVVDHETCEYSYEGVTETQFCAGGQGEGACTGDYGGPAVSILFQVQMGIISSGKGCGRHGVPDLYSDLTNPDLRSFIDSHLERD